MTAVEWLRHANADEVAERAVEAILELADSAIAARGRFRLVLAGGSTPERAYRRLAERRTDYTGWQFYLGDERCLPADHPERNSTMIQRSWLDRVAVAGQAVHWIPAELGPERAASVYEETVRDALPFDVVLLGMGEDGHTASLFPGQSHDPGRLVVPVTAAPKPPPERVSLNYGALCAARAVLVLVTGEGKQEAVRRWRAGEALPVAQLRCRSGLRVLLDEAAWPDS